MKNTRQPFVIRMLITIFAAVVPLSVIQASPFKVLVVMSYEENNPWCEEIKEGIETVLAEKSDITYFYMNTKVDLDNGPKKAKEAYELFRTMRPDGVITADDNAQRMFVLPYLHMAHETPVMFCGVNAAPEEYGYPTANISGILERGHIRESIAFTKQLVPSIKTITFLAKDSPSGQALARQVRRESTSYLTETSLHLIKSVTDLAALQDNLRIRSDAIYIDSMEGVVNPTGNPMSNKEIIEILGEYKKPIIGANQYHVEQGALCAVVKTGQEQGRTAAMMLQRAMQGTPVSEIPIEQNYKGKRVINVSAMKALDIQVRPIILLGAKLIKTTDTRP